ncbi:hypothetical protein DERF_001981 [Dermatophagoides farinae]|uniref:Uncharacterized protein n=1 Tax=Dermatophagoides farinae TaxID=6954 RepID=A0A922ICV6_DERFA|nr:hypothetical protein DERF_001981 [Dermatophagoides farinae]
MLTRNMAITPLRCFMSPGLLLLTLIVLESFLLLSFQVNEAQAFKKLKAKKILKKISPILTLLTYLKTKKKIIPLPVPLPVPLPIVKKEPTYPCPEYGGGYSGGYGGGGFGGGGYGGGFGGGGGGNCK